MSPFASPKKIALKVGIIRLLRTVAAVAIIATITGSLNFVLSLGLESTSYAYVLAFAVPALVAADKAARAYFKEVEFEKLFNYGNDANELPLRGLEQSD